MFFPLTHLPGQGADMVASHVKHGSAAAASVIAVPVGGSQRAPLSLTETLHTDSRLTPAVAERCSSPASTDTVTPAKCAPLELSLNNCSMWPTRRAVAFSLSVWLCVESEMELITASHSHHSLSSSSTIDVDLSLAGAP